MITLQEITNFIAKEAHSASGYEAQLLAKFKAFLETPVEVKPEPAPVAKAAPIVLGDDE